MSDFFRFPHAPHLAWLGSDRPRQDKVLDASELRSLLAAEVLVEEKADGANLGFSVDEHGTLRGQNRGSYKLVRAEFVQNIDEHWSKRPLEMNQLRSAP